MGIRLSRPAVPMATVAVLVTATAAVVMTGGTSASAATATFKPVADTYVQNDAASTNYGTSAQIVVDNSPVRRMFLRFTVSGVSGTVTSAKLRLRTISGNDGSSAGGTFRAMSNTTWSETGTTWNNQPSIDGATLGSIGSVAADGWYEVDVTSHVRGNGTFSFGATSSNTDGAYYDSRESGADAPQLVITTGTTTPPSSGDPVLVGAGDISDSGSGDTATAALLDNISGTVFTTGDNVYSNGTASEFSSYYAPTWGRHKSRTRPSPGNHDYNTSGATGYYNYFGTQAGPSGRGYYSYDLGNWHVVSLNSNISMSAGSAQEQWLRSDLARQHQAVHAGVLAPSALHVELQPRAVDVDAPALPGAVRQQRRRRGLGSQPRVRAVRADEPERRVRRRPGDAQLRRRDGRCRPLQLRHHPAQQRGAEQLGVRRPEVHPARQQLRLAVRAGGRAELQRQRHRRLPLTHPVPAGAVTWWWPRRWAHPSYRRGRCAGSRPTARPAPTGPVMVTRRTRGSAISASTAAGASA